MKKLLAVLLLLASPLLAQDVKISNLTSGSPVQATDMIPIARGGANFRLAGSDFLSSAGGATGCTTPPFSFTADTNAGMCISAANQLVLQTGASNPRGVLSLAYAAANPNVFLQAISSGGVQSGFYAEDPDAGPFKEVLAKIPEQNRNLGVACIDCHNNRDMSLNISRGFTLSAAFKDMGVDPAKLTRQEMRSAVCAQCHVTYNIIKDQEMKSVGMYFPWQGSTIGNISIENIIKQLRSDQTVLEWKQTCDRIQNAVYPSSGI